MASSGPKYYRPFYLNDSDESDASADDSDAESEIMQEAENLPDYVAFANRLYRASGPPFQTAEVDISYATNALDRHTVYGPMVEGQAGYDLVSTTQQLDNVIVLQSLDRDKRIYPQPTNCQLMLPRTYVNVTRFEIADISFIASFFYFRADKYNTNIQFNESGRVTFANVLLNPPIVSPQLDLTLTIREGTYTIDSLLGELTIQFNTPPLFYDFINGYSDFYNKFTNAGDYSINFNYPGDYYYDAVSRVYISNPTTDQIVSYYFQQRYALPTTANNIYTDLQTKIAYYYPVVKELLLDKSYTSTSLTYAGNPLTQAIISQVLYSFTGLDDPIMVDIVGRAENLVILDAYRLAHTFRYFPVNKYVCSYSTQTNYVCIQSTTLNTSLSSLLNATYSNFLNSQIQRAGISLTDFNNASAQITAFKSILSDMYNILQTNLAYQFGINYGDLADTYFLSFSNVVLLKNGLNASNVIYNYNSRVSPFITSNLQNQFRQPTLSYWENMFNIPQSNQAFSNTYIDSNSGVNVYNIQTLNSQLEHPFQDSNGNIYINPVEHSSDIILQINPGAYTIIPLPSKLRQTAQIETLPRPSLYLYPEWNLANADSIGNNQFVFSNGAYGHSFPTGVDVNGVGSNLSYPLSPPLSNLGTAAPLAETYPYTGRLSLQGTPNGLYYSFTTPPADPANSNGVYTYRTALSIFPGSPDPILPTGDVPPQDSSGNTFDDSMTVFVYHDQAAFFADVGPVGKSNGESPFFYKYTTVIPAGSGVQSIVFTAYEAQTYYVYCRATNPTSFVPIFFTLVPHISSNAPHNLFRTVDFDPRLPSFNPYEVMRSNFYVAKVHDPDYIRLPIIDSNGYYYKTNQLSCNIGFLPSASNTPASASINILLQKPTVPLGYSSGVSDDLTDYIPIVNTFPPRAFDPITGYQFRYASTGSSYNTATQTYAIGSGSGNTILNPDGSIYAGSNTTPQREKQIVQYTGTHYIFTGSNEFTSISSNLRPLNSTSIRGLVTPFETRGPCGFLFMPEEGTWHIRRLTFLSQSATTNVDFLAIYPSEYIHGISTKNASLTKAICLCVLSSSVTNYTTAAITGVPYGTYFTYTNVLTVQSNYVIAGRTQNSTAFITDTNSYYSAVAYSFSNSANRSNTTFSMSDFSNSRITTIENLTGTCIPYPDLGIRVTTSFYDGSPAPDNYTLLVSSNAPLTKIDAARPINPTLNANFMYSNFYTSQYALSSPIVNSHLHYLITQFSINDFVNYQNFFLPWYSVPDVPVNIYTTIYGTLMIQTATFPIVSYPVTSEITTFTLNTILTMDMIFPSSVTPLTQYGTSNSFIFLGASGTSLVFAEYGAGVLRTYPYIPSTWNARAYSVQGFVIQGTRWWLAYLDESRIFTLAYGVNFTSTFQTFTFTGQACTSVELAIDPANGTNVYFALRTNESKSFSVIYSYPIASGLPVVDGLPGETVSLADLQPYVVDPTTVHFTVQVTNGVEYLYQVRSPSPYIWRTNTQTFSTVRSPQNLGNQPIKCVTGTNNSIWILFNSQPYIQAYVYTIESMQIAWQQLFPVMKIELVEKEERRLTIPDRNNLLVPEWGHAVGFGYSSQTNLNKDIYYTQPTQFQWGKESQYEVGDSSFQGFYFNAYLGNVPLQASNTSYVALRGFSPTESFQTEVRVSLPNVYDFGYVSFSDMINEIGTLNTNSAQYSATYQRQLSTFDGTFVRSGVDALYGISSFSVPTVSFSNFIVEYSTLYGKYTTLKVNVDTINANLRVSMQNFILNDMQYILPNNILTRTRFTDSLTFSFLWKTGLARTPPNYANLVDGWGLGWNLGYAKEDDTQPSTVHFAPSMYKIIDDFLYLRLNPEFNLNRMSAGTKENYLDSREPSGLTSYYYCKLLLNGYGQTATTFVHSPILLNPPIPRIAKLSFQWLDARGNVLDIPSATDSDWQMTVNIQENVQMTKFVQTSTVTAKAFLSTTKE